MLNITQIRKDYKTNSYKLKNQFEKMKYEELINAYMEIRKFDLVYVEKVEKKAIIAAIFTIINKINEKID